MAHKLLPTLAMPTLPELSELSVRTLTDVFAVTLDGALIVGRDGFIRYINPAYCALLGYQQQELVGQPLSVLWLEYGSLTAALRSIEDIVAEGGRVRFDTLHRRKDAQGVWVEASVAELPEHGALVVFVRDISERKAMEEHERTRVEECVAAAEKLSAVLETTQDGLCSLDRCGFMLSVNDKYCEMVGYSRVQIVGKPISWFEVHKRTDLAVEEHLRAVAEGVGHDLFETEHLHKNGHAVTMEVAVSWLPAYGEFAVFLRDITERKAREESNRQAAFFDTLTQLPNRRMLMDRFLRAASRTARQNTHGAVLFLDIDRLKLLNDTAGHHVGDALLREVALRLTSTVRDGDSVVRLGGDEFVVLFEDLPANAPDAEVQALVLAERVRAALAHTYQLGRHVHHGGCSVGLALFRGASEQMDEVLRRADVAMYAAKQAGGCAVRICDAEISS